MICWRFILRLQFIRKHILSVTIHPSLYVYIAPSHRPHAPLLCVSIVWMFVCKFVSLGGLHARAFERLVVH